MLAIRTFGMKKFDNQGPSTALTILVAGVGVQHPPTVNQP